jgi:NitT/TauT family transport system substrate-binding protein
MVYISRRSLISAVLAAPFAVKASASLAANKSINLVYPNVVILYTPLYVAVKKGFFKDEGIDTKLIVGGGGAKTRQVLAAGEADYGLADASHSLLLTSRGRKAKLLSATDRRCGAIQMVVRKDLYDQGVTSLEKLAEWKRPNGSKPIVGAPALGGTAHLWASFVTDKLGVTEKFLWLGVGTVDTVMGGLQSKQFDLVLCTPAMQADAKARGWGELIFDGLSDEVAKNMVGGDAPVTAHFALQETIEKDRPLAQAYVNANYRAAQWMKDRPPEEICDTLEEFLGNNSRTAALEELETNKIVFDYNMAIRKENYDRGGPIWFRELTNIKPIPFEDAVDVSFIEAAHKAIKA